MDVELQQGFASFAGDPDADELRALLLVNRLLVPDLDTAAVTERLRSLERGSDTSQTPWRYLREQGFFGNEEDYAALDNSRLDRMLETRRGIPISLAVLLIHLARRNGLRAQGINFPGHFLVRIEKQLVDPFRMEETSEEACLAGRPDLAGQSLPALFEAADPAAVLLRMLNNLKFAFARAMAWHRALDVVDAQIILVPREPGLYLERGDFWRRLGVVSAAREAYQEALKLAAGSGAPRLDEIGQAARARLAGLDGESDIVH